jgi:hypothetical protein
MPRLDPSRPLGARYPFTRGEIDAQTHFDSRYFWASRNASGCRHDEKLWGRMESDVGRRPSKDDIQSLFNDVLEVGLQSWRGSRANGCDVRSDDTTTTHEGLRCEVERYVRCRQSKDHIQSLLRDLLEEVVDLAKQIGAFGIPDAPASFCIAVIPFRARRG